MGLQGEIKYIMLGFVNVLGYILLILILLLLHLLFARGYVGLKAKLYE